MVTLAKFCWDDYRYLHSSTVNRDAHCRLESEMCAMAAKQGNLAVLQYLHSVNCGMGDSTIDNAAEYGHLVMWKWVALQNGSTWGARTCTNAARNGHLELLKWVKQNGCPWDRSTCSSAAQNGHLDVLRSWSTCA